MTLPYRLTLSTYKSRNDNTCWYSFAPRYLPDELGWGRTVRRDTDQYIIPTMVPFSWTQPLVRPSRHLPHEKGRVRTPSKDVDHRALFTGLACSRTQVPQSCLLTSPQPKCGAVGTTTKKGVWTRGKPTNWLTPPQPAKDRLFILKTLKKKKISNFMLTTNQVGPAHTGDSIPQYLSPSGTLISVSLHTSVSCPESQNSRLDSPSSTLMTELRPPGGVTIVGLR